MIDSVFLDLDDTIFDFHKAEAIALEDTLREMGITPNQILTARYSEINLAQWKRLELGIATREEILTDRFKIFFEEIGADVDARKARQTYEDKLGCGHYFIDGAEELLDNLKGKYRLFLASNGTAAVQVRRIASSGIEKYFDAIFISQTVGYDKPSKEYFDKCFASIPNFSKKNAIIIGDSISSDIKGGINAGIKTCLFNPKHRKNETDVKPDFEIFSLSEIPTLLSNL